MKSARTATHPVRTFGLWALGGAAAYLIIRELTDRSRHHAGVGPTTPSTMSEHGNREVDQSAQDLEQRLDAAVDATFPASDPYSMVFE